MRKVVEGSYPTVRDALLAVERLRDAGHGKDEIFLVGDKNVQQELARYSNLEVEDVDALAGRTETDARSLWDRVREAFSVDNYDPGIYTREDRGNEEDALQAYQEEVAKGNILVLLRRREEEESLKLDADTGSKSLSGGTAAGKRASDYIGVDSQTPRTINSTGNIPLGDEASTLADPEKPSM